MKGLESGQILETPQIETQNIGLLIKQCMAHQLAIALYQKPNDPEQHFIVDFNQGKSIEKINIDELSEGFIFFPFEYTPAQPGKFINADVHLILDTDRKTINYDPSESLEKLRIKLSDSPDEENDNELKANSKASLAGGSKEVSESHYKNIVSNAIREIKSGSFLKVVLAKNKKIALAENFDIYTFFKALCTQYPQTFVSVVYTPETGLWIGASPEVLIRQSMDNVFYTTALAGTQPYHEGMNLSEASWTQKDIEEQALVGRYIINCFKKIRLREYDEIGPKTIKAGNLLHLKTDYYVDLNQIKFPQLASIMLELLHPTSAVCGMPKDPTLRFINESEGFRRKYYSGYLGPVNIDQSTDIFVNLRCMKLEDRHAELYAGAGITADSNPDKEWIETELKFGTLMDVIRKISR